MTTFDLSKLGVDANIGMFDHPGAVGLAEKLLNLGNAWVRRVSCGPQNPDGTGGNFYDDDYSDVDVTDHVNATMGPADAARLRALISTTIEKDERCDSCVADVVQDPSTGAITITLTGTLAIGIPFAFVMQATGATVALLEINGVSVAAAATGTPANPGVQLRLGPPGPQGPTGQPGSSGASGTPQWVGGTGADDWTSPVDGTEGVVFESEVNFDALPGTLTFQLVGDFYVSAAATGTFKISYGGTLGVPDGTVVGAPLTTTSTAPTAGSITAGGIVNPGGTRLVKVTSKASVAGPFAGVSAHGLTIR